MLYPGPSGSPTGMLYEVIGEVELVPAETPKLTESGRLPDQGKTLVPEWIRSSQV